jgi:hypothetical protein
MRKGNCYVTCEALYHLLGGKDAGWKPMVLNISDGDNHWFLKHESGMILDPTKSQYGKNPKIPYNEARGCGFLTKKPSKRAAVLMDTLVWQENA